MGICHTSAIERIARVLAGERLSANANGMITSAGDEIDNRWRDYVGEAVAVLKTLREPDAAMAAAGDAVMWEAMVAAALDAAPPA